MAAFEEWSRPAHYLHMADQFAEPSGREADHEVLNSPAGFVFAVNTHHAIELDLKAWLLVHGLSDDELRRTFGHKISRLVRECIRRGLPVSRNDQILIDALAAFRLAELEGCSLKELSLPASMPELVALTARLHDAIAPHVEREGTPKR